MVSYFKKKLYWYKRWWLINFPKNFSNLAYSLKEPPVFACGIPKCGTNLMVSAMRQIPYLQEASSRIYFGNDFESLEAQKTYFSHQRKGMFSWGHVVPHLDILNIIEKRRFKTLLIIRDPRDLVCSHVVHATKIRPHYRFNNYYTNVLKNHKDRLIASIIGIDKMHSRKTIEEEKNKLDAIDKRFRDFLSWQNYSHNLLVKFEDLIGAKGGGDDSVQLETFIKMCQHLNIELPLKKAKILAGNIFNSKSNTFNKGQIGAWRDQFDDEVKDIFKSVAGDLLIELGYEINYDW